MIVLIGGEKGGTGKTTIATNLAAMRATAGHDVLLLDTDSQGTSSHWAETRAEKEHQPPVRSVQKFGKGVRAEVRDLAKRYKDIIIDAGGRNSTELREAMVVAQNVYIPVQASQFDIWTLEQMDTLIQHAQTYNDNLRARILVNRASNHPGLKDREMVQELVAEYETLSLATTVIHERVAFRKAALAGLGTVELESKESKAAAEMRELYLEVFGDDY